MSKLSSKLKITKTELQSSINWVLTKVVNNIDMLDKQKNILSYLSNSVRNFCIDEYRKVMVRKRRESNYRAVSSIKNSGLTHTLEFMLEDITKSEEEKTILTKIILEKEDLESISRDLNIPIKKIDSLMKRIRSELSC